MARCLISSFLLQLFVFKWLLFEEVKCFPTQYAFSSGAIFSLIPISILLYKLMFMWWNNYLLSCTTKCQFLYCSNFYLLKDWSRVALNHSVYLYHGLLWALTKVWLLCHGWSLMLRLMSWFRTIAYWSLVAVVTCDWGEWNLLTFRYTSLICMYLEQNREKFNNRNHLYEILGPSPLYVTKDQGQITEEADTCSL